MSSTTIDFNWDAAHLEKKSLGFGIKVLVFGFGFVLEQK
jgi:hypothetical protein